MKTTLAEELGITDGDSADNVFTGQMTLAVDGVTAEDLRQSMKTTLAEELGITDQSLIVVTVTESRRLQTSSGSLRRLIGWWTVSFSVRRPASSQVASVESAAEDIKSNYLGFSQSLKSSLASTLETSGRSSSSMSTSFAISSFESSVVTTTMPPTPTVSPAPTPTVSVGSPSPETPASALDVSGSPSGCSSSSVIVATSITSAIIWFTAS